MAPRGLTPDDRRIWDRVARSVEAHARKKAAFIDPQTAAAVTTPAARPELKAPPRFVKPPKVAVASPSVATPGAARSVAIPEVLEPRRQRRLARERDPIEATLDLHGFGRFEAQDQVAGFLTRSQARGLRAVLLITGQGRRGGGVIRASVQEWLQAPALRGVVSGFSSAHRRHGGEGAVYVALKRR